MQVGDAVRFNDLGKSTLRDAWTQEEMDREYKVVSIEKSQNPLVSPPCDTVIRLLPKHLPVRVAWSAPDRVWACFLELVPPPPQQKVDRFDAILGED